MNFSSSGHVLLFFAQFCWPIIVPQCLICTETARFIPQEMIDVSNYVRQKIEKQVRAESKSHAAAVRHFSYFPRWKSTGSKWSLSVLSVKAPR